MTLQNGNEKAKMDAARRKELQRRERWVCTACNIVMVNSHAPHGFECWHPVTACKFAASYIEKKHVKRFLRKRDR